MCFPALIAAVPLITLATTAVSAAAAGVQYYAQTQQSDAQAHYENTLYWNNVHNVKTNLAQQYASTQNQLNQQQAATTQQATQNAIQGQGAIGQMKAQTGARGAIGNSTQQALLNFQRIENQNNATLQTNLNWAKAQGYQQDLAYQAQAKTAIASATPAPVAPPSAAALGLNVLGIGLNGVDKYMQQTNQGGYNPPPQA